LSQEAAGERCEQSGAAQKCGWIHLRKSIIPELPSSQEDHPSPDNNLPISGNIGR
jgi:hypothetical protein